MQYARPRNWTAAGCWRNLEHFFDPAFGGALNPLKHLGALACMLFGLLAATGIVLYAVLDTSAQGAYRSIDELTREPWSPGSALRGLHRYAADAFVVVTFAHLAREWMLGRFRGFRRYSWLTGVPLLPLAYISGIGGFWLNWDRLGQFSATATAEWLDALPLLASPLARNFLGGAVSDRLFSLFVFVHIGVPLLLLFALWFHIQRISRAEILPRRALAVGTLLTLLALALLVPIRSQGPADLAVVPQAVALDWFLLFIHPFADVLSAGWVWASVCGVLALLFALPFLPRLPVLAGDTADNARDPAPVAVVDPAHCNGCRRCADDCPYGAITMVSHVNGRRGAQMAQVNANLCAGCGICAGACPSSTPSRTTETLLTGIDMPSSPVDGLRRRLVRWLTGARADRGYVVFGCNHGADVRTLAAPDVLPLSLPCAGALPPSFVEYALRAGVQGVLVAGCRECGCEYRLGQRWTVQRLRGEREPRLRGTAAAGRLNSAWADAGDERALHCALEALRGSNPSLSNESAGVAA